MEPQYFFSFFNRPFPHLIPDQESLYINWLINYKRLGLHNFKLNFQVNLPTFNHLCHRQTYLKAAFVMFGFVYKKFRNLKIKKLDLHKN